MAERKRLVLDANILIRGCLGVRVRALIADSAREVDFFVAEANASEASGYLSELAARRGLDPQICQEAFLSLMEVVQIVDSTWIETAREEALNRIRDPADWPALALALQLECAIWTEDQDFFGTGVATWTTATVQRYLDC
jgi:predicted nucleic acid-binding protein